jgi:hypothetical protein
MIYYKIIAVLLITFNLYQYTENKKYNSELKKNLAIADSLENVISINDSIIINLKSEYLIALNQVHKDSVNVENFRKNRPKKLKGLNIEEINSKFNDYFKSIRSK